MPVDLYPSSIPKVTRGLIYHLGINWKPIYCANCGVDAGLIPEDATCAFSLCDDCGQVHGVPPGMMQLPDEAHWSKVNDAQLEKYGRVLDPLEQLDELRDPDSMLSKLVRDK